MRVMSFNVLCGGDGVKMVSVRKPLVVEILRQYMPDTFGLQESHREWMGCVTKAMPEYAYVGVGRDDGKEQGEFAPVFYRRDKFDLIDSGNFWLSETPDTPGKGWDAVCVRICSFAILQDKETGKKFSHFNTHLDHRGPIAQSEGAGLIAQRADAYPGVPTIVTGDFNVTPDSGAYKTITSAGFLDTRYEAESGDGKENIGTYHAFGRCHDIIDYIFVKNNITVSTFQTITDLVKDSYPSDHYPVMAEIEF